MERGFGERLRSAREVAGLGAQDAAAASGVDSWRLERAEAGECDLRFTEVFRLAATYGVTLDWLSGREASPWETFEPPLR